MKREELIAMGISEENVEKIIADYGSAVQRPARSIDGKVKNQCRAGKIRCQG